jgi:hypothetical protein
MDQVLLQNAATASRIVSIAHRVKARVKDGVVTEALPTRVTICDSAGKIFTTLNIEDEADELLFVRGIYPTDWVAVDPANYKKPARDSDVLWGKAKAGESWPDELIENINGEQLVPRKTATSWDGLQKGDTVLMLLGGSGDPLAYAISRQGEDAGFNLYRMPGWALKEIRGEKPSDQNARDISEMSALVNGWKLDREQFYHCDPADRERMSISAMYNDFKRTQKVRMGFAANMRQSLIGRVFMSAEGLFPEGAIKSLLTRFAEAVKELFPKGRKKSGPAEVLEQLEIAEHNAKADLEKAVQSSRVWGLFEAMQGIGPSIGGALISAIGDIRKFSGHEKLWAFCGLHTLKPDGTKFQKGDEPTGGIMARRRSGQLCNWNPTARQALYLLAEQFNRRPNTYWGKKLLENKASLRDVHPEKVTNEAGKLRYNDGHIHKMALWKTLRQFMRVVYREWKLLEMGSKLEVQLVMFQDMTEEQRQARSAMLKKQGVTKKTNEQQLAA